MIPLAAGTVMQCLRLGKYSPVGAAKTSERGQGIACSTHIHSAVHLLPPTVHSPSPLRLQIWVPEHGDSRVWAPAEHLRAVSIKSIPAGIASFCWGQEDFSAA